MNNLGEVLKDRRKSKELKLRQLEAMSGVGASYLGRIEQGKRFPSARILKKLTVPLGFTEVELLKLAGYMSQDDTDGRLEKFKDKMKMEITATMGNLLKKVDSL